MEPVDPSRPLRLLHDQARLPQQAQVARDGRPADWQYVRDLLDGASAAAEHLQDRAAIGVAERIERVAREIARPAARAWSDGNTRVTVWANDATGDGELEGGPGWRPERGTKDDPWNLKTPPQTSDYQMYRDDSVDPPVIVCIVGGTKLGYLWRAVDDLHAMLKANGDWVPLGAADEQKEAAPGTVEAWGRVAGQPGRRLVRHEEGLRGRFGMYMPPLLEALGLAEVEHNPRNNRMRAK